MMLLQSFRLSFRYIISLAIVLSLFAYAVFPFVDRLILRWFISDLDTRSQLVADSIHESLSIYIPTKSELKINQLFDRVIRDERLYAVGFCNTQGVLEYKTITYPGKLGCRKALMSDYESSNTMLRLPHGLVHYAVRMLDVDGVLLGKIVLIHDLSFIETRSAYIKKYIVALFLALAIAISWIIIIGLHLTWKEWAKTVKNLLRGHLISSQSDPVVTEVIPPPAMEPLLADLRSLLRDIEVERHSYEDYSQAWTPDTLRGLLKNQFARDQVIVVSNREPYIHTRTPTGIKVSRPASGLITAVEPVMRACSGTWVAHGGGSADRDVVDEHSRILVPPGQSAYTLRRIWLTKEEEQGYYYGFANEGLWPLCHVAHVRPVFRATDWQKYVEVNQRFADAVVSEARTDDPVVLVQDYHFALLPRMVHEALPKATIITFWHIPWPNPESFGICPWREEILEGLLGSTILGFHTGFHCKNFMETVDRYLETRIEHETSTISYGGKLTQVRRYPISIEWTEPASSPTDEADKTSATPNDYKDIRQELGLPENHLLGVGVDRLDYTKGILERFQAVERLFEIHPELIGRFTFVQIAAPTRSILDEYQNFEGRVRALAAKINQRFSSDSCLPILLRIEYHPPELVNRFYRAADVCMVTSLHDGMNLVAKEYIAAREDERGVLILSQFTGAARELHESLIINPYDIEQSAEALYRALTMPAIEQRERMRSMRALVRDFNIYRWAGRMLLDAARLRERERVAEKIQRHSRGSLRRA